MHRANGGVCWSHNAMQHGRAPHHGQAAASAAEGGLSMSGSCSCFKAPLQLLHRTPSWEKTAGRRREGRGGGGGGGGFGEVQSCHMAFAPTSGPRRRLCRHPAQDIHGPILLLSLQQRPSRLVSESHMHQRTTIQPRLQCSAAQPVPCI